ncbi:MAG: hypothetical protein R2827_16105 [Bdellovibrionales bacterium]
MEDIAPPLSLVLHIIACMRNGESIRVAVERFQCTSDLDFQRQAQELVFRYDQGSPVEYIFENAQSPYRCTIFELIQMALSGQPTLAQFENLKVDIEMACDMELEQTLRVLPFKLMVPMMIFMVPAYLLALFGPILNLFLKGVKF